MDSRKQQSILVVDDEKANINVLVGLLKKNYRILVAKNGEKALDTATREQPDLVLLDIMMPKMDGYEVCEQLKANEQTRDIPVIFLTAKTQVDDEQKGLEIGAVDYITKPISPAIVRARVKTQLNLRMATLELKKQRDCMQHSLDLAMEVQQQLIPRRDPSIPWLDVAGRIIYCDETGGDYYDYLDRGPAGGLTVVIGDVSDHGIPSALLMTTARALIRQRAMAPGSLAEVIGDVNIQFCKDVEKSGRFMTLFMCDLDVAGRQISWTRAGHDPGLIYDLQRDSFFELDGAGMPLGVMAGVQFEEQRRALAPGQIIILSTDGIWEANNPDGEQYGKDRFRSAVRDFASLTAAEIADGLVREVEAFRASHPQEDDVTLVVLKIEVEDSKL